MDYQAEFMLLTMDKLGKAAADAIDWSAPRLLCVAADFTKYDGHTVQQINRNRRPFHSLAVTRCFDFNGLLFSD